MITQGRSLRKSSGGFKRPHRKKRLFDRGSQPTMTKLGAEKRLRIDRKVGGKAKPRLLQVLSANVLNLETGKYALAKIKTVSNNPANRYYTRANILTRGAIIDTELGKAKVTNRPGQEGVVNAVLMNIK